MNEEVQEQSSEQAADFAALQAAAGPGPEAGCPGFV